MLVALGSSCGAGFTEARSRRPFQQVTYQNQSIDYGLCICNSKHCAGAEDLMTNVSCRINDAMTSSGFLQQPSISQTLGVRRERGISGHDGENHQA